MMGQIVWLDKMDFGLAMKTLPLIKLLDFLRCLSDAMGEVLVAGDLARFMFLAKAASTEAAMADLKNGVDLPMLCSLLP
ncbi:hypothetical protein ACLOJK_014796 [Asimina triloba]